MPVSAIPSLVPDVADFIYGLWFFLVQFLQKTFLHFFAVSVFPLHIYLQCFINQILLAVHDVCNVAECSCRIGCCIHMNMDTGIFPGYGSCVS